MATKKTAGAKKSQGFQRVRHAIIIIAFAFAVGICFYLFYSFPNCHTLLISAAQTAKILTVFQTTLHIIYSE